MTREVVSRTPRFYWDWYWNDVWPLHLWVTFWVLYIGAVATSIIF